MIDQSLFLMQWATLRIGAGVKEIIKLILCYIILVFFFVSIGFCYHGLS